MLGGRLVCWDGGEECIGRGPGDERTLVGLLGVLVGDLFLYLFRARQGLNRVVGIWSYRGLLRRGFHALLFLRTGLVARVVGLLYYIRWALGCDTVVAGFGDVWLRAHREWLWLGKRVRERGVQFPRRERSRLQPLSVHQFPARGQLLRVQHT